MVIKRGRLVFSSVLVNRRRVSWESISLIRSLPLGFMEDDVRFLENVLEL